ncbi:MAG: hypothetical protein JWR39_2467 [Devosia sp.]|nr:hypothetical protein [Devosia sp.]
MQSCSGPAAELHFPFTSGQIRLERLLSQGGAGPGRDAETAPDVQAGVYAQYHFYLVETRWRCRDWLARSRAPAMENCRAGRPRGWNAPLVDAAAA